MRAHSPPGSALEAEYRTYSEMQEEIHPKEDFLWKHTEIKDELQVFIVPSLLQV